MRWIAPTLAGLIFTAFVGVVVFSAAGRMDFPFVWMCLGLNGLFWIAAAIVLPADLVRERVRPGAEGRVRDYHRAIAIPLLIASWILAGLDLGHLHWSDTIPRILQIAGLIGYAIGVAATLWAMAHNRFYSSVIRLQRDRGQYAVSNGPYQFIRHPGYFGTICAFIGGGLALGSWLGMTPLVFLILLFFRRTSMEDSMLRRELEGYEEYAGRVRSRLMPGVW